MRRSSWASIHVSNCPLRIVCSGFERPNELMLAGVTMEKPESISVDVEVEIGQDTYLEPGVQLRGKTRIGIGCRIGSGSISARLRSR